MIEPFGQYSRAGGTFGALRKQSVSDNAVKENKNKTQMVAPEQPKNQILPTEKIPENREPLESQKDKLFRKYGKSTTTWPNDMLLEDMDRMVNFKCFSSRPEDEVAMKVMRRFMEEKSARKQVRTFQFTLLLFKILSPHMLCLLQLESENAKLNRLATAKF